MGTLQVGGTTLGVKNTSTNKVDLSNTGTLDNLPFYACRAWVNFDGTKDTSGATSTANTNRLIRASGNVASVLRNGTGLYTINFSTEMPDANYSVCVSGMGSDDNRYTGIGYGSSMTTSTFRVYGHYHADGSYQDMQVMCVSIFR